MNELQRKLDFITESISSGELTPEQFKNVLTEYELFVDHCMSIIVGTRV